MAVHASTHLKSDPHAAAQLCGQCLTSAPLQNMVGGGAIVVADIDAAPALAVAGAAHHAAPYRAFSAFRSRAPPGSF